MADGDRSSDFSASLWKALAATDVTAKDRAAILKALRRLDKNEQHPPLRIKKRAGDRNRPWSAPATGSLRLSFERLDAGRERMLTVAKVHDR